MLIVGNPKSTGIRQAAYLAHRDGGWSVNGQSHWWLRTPPDPGKSWFWRMELVHQGVPGPVASRIVSDLELIKRGW